MTFPKLKAYASEDGHIVVYAVDGRVAMPLSYGKADSLANELMDLLEEQGYYVES